MPEIDPVILQLIADTRQQRAQLAAATRVTQQQLGAQGRAISVLEERMNSGFTRIGHMSGRSAAMISSSMNAIKASIAGVVTIQIARKFLEMSDEAKKLDATLKLATSGFGSFGQAQKDVRAIADETRSGLSETASLYANFVRGAKELGGTQAEASRATETFSKTLKISGADANQAASATLQFGQALAAGALRGDELNSILEASPRLARLLAESMGRPIGEIKKLGEAGALTSDKLLRALTDKKFTAGIDAEFKQLPVTFDDAMTKVSNAALVTFSAFDRGGQFSQFISNFFEEGADGFSSLEDRAYEAGAEFRAVFAGLTDVFEPMVNAAMEAFGQIEDQANYARDSIASILRAIDNVDNALKSIDNFGRNFDNRIKRGLNEAQRRAGAGPNAVYFQEKPLAEMSDRAGTFTRGYDRAMRLALAQRGEEWIQRASSGYDIMGNPIAGTPGGARTKPPASPTSGGKKGKSQKSPLDADAYAREEAALNDQILRLKGDEVVDLTTRAKFETDRIEAARAASQKEIEADKRFTPAQKEKLVALNNTVAAMQASAVIAARDEELAKQVEEARRGNLRYERDALEAQAMAANTRQDRLDIERRILKAMEEAEAAELEAAIAAGRIADAAKARADLATAQAARRSAAETQYESPLARRRREVQATARDMTDTFEDIQLDAIDRLTDGIADASTEFIKLGGIAGDVINGIIRDMVRLAAQQAIFGKAGGGGILGSIGGLFGIGGGAASGGGIVVNHNAWGGFRAAGGPVAVGKSYIVGENGPELFTPASSGSIIPNHQLAAAHAMTRVDAAPVRNVTQVTQVLKLDLRDAVMTPELLDQMNQKAQAAAVGGAMAGSQDAQRTLARRGRNTLR